MGSKGTTTPSTAVTDALTNNINALTQIAGTETTNAQTLFNLTEPGLVASENFAENLMSGNPQAVLTALAPATQQITQSTQGAIKNIETSTPPGGEKNLAIENAQASQGAQIGSTAANAVANAPAMLANLSGTGIGESISAAGTGVGALSAGSSAAGTLGSEQLQEQQIQAENKGSMLGAFTGLAGAGATVGGAEAGKKGTEALAAAVAA